MVYQTDMLDWPHEHQRYNYVHRHGTKAYVPTGDNKGGHMMILTQYYERLPAMADNILPMEYRDEYTDHMIHQGRMLHSKTNKPIMPGRGMGFGDAPDLKIIGDIDPSDIHQGSVGDCWLLSGILAMAEFDRAIKQLFCMTMRLDKRPLPKPNMYIVTLLDLETWTENDTYVDECLLVKSDVSRQILATTPSEDGELRVCYLEKAMNHIKNKQKADNKGKDKPKDGEWMKEKPKGVKNRGHFSKTVGKKTYFWCPYHNENNGQ